MSATTYPIWGVEAPWWLYVLRLALLAALVFVALMKPRVASFVVLFVLGVTLMATTASASTATTRERVMRHWMRDLNDTSERLDLDSFFILRCGERACRVGWNRSHHNTHANGVDRCWSRKRVVCVTLNAASSTFQGEL